MVAIGVDGSDQAGAEAKGAGMVFSACVFDAVHPDATLVPGRGHDRTRMDQRLRLTGLGEMGRGYVLTSVGIRVAPASPRAIGTEVSW